MTTLHHLAKDFFFLSSIIHSTITNQFFFRSRDGWGLLVLSSIWGANSMKILVKWSSAVEMLTVEKLHSYLGSGKRGIKKEGCWFMLRNAKYCWTLMSINWWGLWLQPMSAKCRLNNIWAVTSALRANLPPQFSEIEKWMVWCRASPGFLTCDCPAKWLDRTKN